MSALLSMLYSTVLYMVRHPHSRRDPWADWTLQSTKIQLVILVQSVVALVNYVQEISPFARIATIK